MADGWLDTMEEWEQFKERLNPPALVQFIDFDCKTNLTPAEIDAYILHDQHIHHPVELSETETV